MHSSRITLGALCAAILLLPACGPSYQRKALMPLCEKAAQYEETKNGIRLRARKMNKREADCVFKGRGKYLYSGKNPIYPIHISVANNTPQPITCNPTQTTLICANPKEVTACLQHYTGLKTVALVGLGTALCLVSGAGAFFLLLGSAMAFQTGAAVGAGITAVTDILGYTCVGLLVLTPTAGIYYGTTWSKDNKRIAHDICAKTAHFKDGAVTIAANNEFSYILFADSKSFKQQFDVSVNTTVFNVDLEQNKNS